MRTKALVLSAMLGIAGICSSVAQNVYSVNVVGYTTVTLTNAFSLIANQLDNGAGNLVTNLFAGVPGNTAIYKYNPATGAYVQLTFVVGPGWTPVGNRQMTLAPGEGVFVKNPSAPNPLTVTFVGEVMQGTLVNPVLVGFDIYSGMVPQQGGLVSVHGYVPSPNDIVYKFNGVGYNPKTYNASFTPPRWTPGANTEPVLEVNEAVFIKSTAAKDWTRTFTVN